jgi:hypothetical protein
MTVMAFDRARLEILRNALAAALEDLRLIRIDDVHAAEAMRCVRSASRTLDDICIPRVHDILTSTAMTWYKRAGAACDNVTEAALVTARERRWEMVDDPLSGLGPPSRACRTFDDVLHQMRSGALTPMSAPIDANGRALAHYTSLTFEPADTPFVLGQIDLRSNIDKLVDFFSDALPIGMRKHHTLTVYYLTGARVVSNVHTLTAYDRDEGPETDWDRGTAATVSGYMVVEDDSSVAEIVLPIGPEGSDPTAGRRLFSQESSGYSGVFYPDEPPVFEPVNREPSFGNPDVWTFTTSAAPMVDGWGTWGL